MGNKASERWGHLSRRALDLLFPPRCAGCGALGEAWCAKCHASVRRIAEPLCQRCGLPAAHAADCPACANHSFSFDASRSWGVYTTELRQAILSLKHRENAGLGAVFARFLYRVLAAHDWPVDVLIPIPLGPHRLLQRGYNQSALLARPLGELAGLHYAERALLRRHDTLPQFELNAAERWTNLQGVFVADPAPLAGLSVLLVDDIMTTGATLDSAARALREAGAKGVYGLTLARALAVTRDP